MRTRPPRISSHALEREQYPNLERDRARPADLAELFVIDLHYWNPSSVHTAPILGHLAASLYRRKAFRPAKTWKTIKNASHCIRLDAIMRDLRIDLSGSFGLSLSYIIKI